MTRDGEKAQFIHGLDRWHSQRDSIYSTQTLDCSFTPPSLSPNLVPVTFSSLISNKRVNSREYRDGLESVVHSEPRYGRSRSLLQVAVLVPSKNSSTSSLITASKTEGWSGFVICLVAPRRWDKNPRFGRGLAFWAS